MATASQPVRLVADVTMQVPRNATGTLDDGVENVLSGVDVVTEVVDVDVTSLRPRLNDLRVDATVTVTADLVEAADEEAAGRDALADGFGVEAVESVSVDRAAASAGRPMHEYG